MCIWLWQTFITESEQPAELGRIYWGSLLALAPRSQCQISLDFTGLHRAVIFMSGTGGPTVRPVRLGLLARTLRGPHHNDLDTSCELYVADVHCI